jgi:monothiol glutaredoxin
MRCGAPAPIQPPVAIREIRYHFTLSLIHTGTARSVMDTQQRIKQIVDENPVVLFMKGNAQFPMCGFSGRAVQILKACGVDQFKTVNVLEDDEVRQGIKEFSNWPTIPQLYVNGEFVGGSDIMMEMYQSGELQQLFAAA